MGQHLVAARCRRRSPPRTGCLPDDCTALARRGPRRRRSVAGAAPRARRTPRAARRAAVPPAPRRPRRRRRHAAARRGQVPRERDRLPGDLDGPGRVGLHQHQDHQHPQRSSRSTTAGASAPLPRICTSLGCGGGSSSRTRLGPTGSVVRAVLDRDLLRLHPAWDGRSAARRRPRGPSRRRQAGRAVSWPSGPRSRRPAVLDAHGGHAVDDPAEPRRRAGCRPGSRRCRRRRCRAGRGPASPADARSRTTAAISGRRRPDRAARGRSRRGSRRCTPPPARHGAARRRRRPQGQHAGPAPVAAATWIASSTAHSSWRLVKPAYRPSTLWPSSVSTTSPEESGTRLMQTNTSDVHRMRSLAGSSSAVASTERTVTGYSSSMYETASSVPSTACSGGR